MMLCLCSRGSPLGLAIALSEFTVLAKEFEFPRENTDAGLLFTDIEKLVKNCSPLFCFLWSLVNSTVLLSAIFKNYPQRSVTGPNVQRMSREAETCEETAILQVDRYHLPQLLLPFPLYTNSTHSDPFVPSDEQQIWPRPPLIMLELLVLKLCGGATRDGGSNSQRSSGFHNCNLSHSCDRDHSLVCSCLEALKSLFLSLSLFPSLSLFLHAFLSLCVSLCLSFFPAEQPEMKRFCARMVELIFYPQP